jgi:predicted DsbA family dithiol-disulfide isomerase
MYFGTVRIEQLRREYTLDLRWSVFPLHPEIPEEGMELSDLFAGRVDVPAVLARLRRVATEVGLPLGDRTRTFNSRRAQELGKWAEQGGSGDRFRAAVYRAYFVDGRNIARPEELKSIAVSAGLPGEEAMQVLAENRFTAAVDADWQRALNLGLTGVPTHLYNGRVLVGFQSYEAFRRLVTNVGK